MKKMRVSLNDKVYEVTVEILEDDEPHYPGAASPAWAPPPPAAATASAAPLSPPAAPMRRPTPPAGGNAVFAPIVGTVTKVLVQPGASVKENQPLIVLDAMKMDTYINSPRAGTVQTIECAVGDAVKVGQKLATLA
jgi:biotin carboxyl carrier protein